MEEIFLKIFKYFKSLNKIIKNIFNVKYLVCTKKYLEIYNILFIRINFVTYSLFFIY